MKPDDNAAAIEAALAASAGLVTIAGPVASGRSTSAYRILTSVLARRSPATSLAIFTKYPHEIPSTITSTAFPSLADCLAAPADVLVADLEQPMTPSLLDALLRRAQRSLVLATILVPQRTRARAVTIMFTVPRLSRSDPPRYQPHYLFGDN